VLSRRPKFARDVAVWQALSSLQGLPPGSAGYRISFGALAAVVAIG